MGLQLAIPVSWCRGPKARLSLSLRPGLQCQGGYTSTYTGASWSLHSLQGEPWIDPSFCSVESRVGLAPLSRPSAQPCHAVATPSLQPHRAIALGTILNPSTAQSWSCPKPCHLEPVPSPSPSLHLLEPDCWPLPPDRGPHLSSCPQPTQPSCYTCIFPKPKMAHPCLGTTPF